jgi:hypothetical protein
MPGWTTQHREKVAGGDVRCGDTPIWWKKWFNGKGAVRHHGDDLLEVGEMGKSN